MRLVVALIVLIVLGSVGVSIFAPSREHRKPVVDGKSAENFKKSFAAVRLSLPEPQRGAFDQASELLWSATAASAGREPAQANSSWRSRLHGLDATGVFAASLQALVETRGLVQANESAAVTMLRNMVSAQAHCQNEGTIDRNKNGTGEYVSVSELTKLEVIPDTATPQRGGTFSHCGYVFRLYLPGARAAFVPASGANVVNAEHAEELWCAYAWPLVAGESGNRIFFVNQGGDVLAAAIESGRYSGLGSPPDPTAAYAAPMQTGEPGEASMGRILMDSAPAVDMPSGDGLAWSIVN